jgi:hypothetical protein
MPESAKRKLADLSPQVESESARRKMENVSGIDYCDKIQVIMDDVKVKLGTTLTAMELSGDQPTAGEFKGWIGTLVQTLMGGMENQASVVSDMAMEMGVMREALKVRDIEVGGLKTLITDQEKVVKEVAKAKDKVEIKASAKEMEDKLRTSISQFKIMDIDIGKETEDRKEIVNLGLAEIKKKIRQDHVKEFEELVKDVEIAPLTRKTFKGTGKNYFSAPLLFTVQDKARRWKLEDMLRGSKIYPGFHWPQEMINPVKEYRRILREEGRVNEDSTYIRIRPVERDGRLRIRADVKDKTSTGRFVPRASWGIPPIDPEVRNKARDLLIPDWLSPSRGLVAIRSYNSAYRRCGFFQFILCLSFTAICVWLEIEILEEVI